VPGKNGKERSGKAERNVAVRQPKTQQSGVTRPSRAAQQQPSRAAQQDKTLLRGNAYA